MKDFLSIDSKLYKYCTMLGDMILLTILWLLCSIPLITTGAATTGIYYVLTRMLSGREGYVTGDFFKSFKQNFLQATILTVFLYIAGFLVYFNFMHLQEGSILLPMQYVLCFELTSISIYIFPILSRFDMSVPKLIQTAFFMANKHLLTTFTCFILFVALIALCLYQPILIIVCVGFYGWLTSLMFMKLFKKYIPDMDKDLFKTNAEIAAESEVSKEVNDISEN